MVTIHDVTFFTDPERYTASHAMSLKSATMASARQATRLIVPSNATRDELVRVLGMDPAKIDVAYHGVDHSLFHRPTRSRSPTSPRGSGCAASRTSPSSGR